MFNLMFLAVYETLSIIRTDGALFSHFLHTNTHRKEKKKNTCFSYISNDI